MDRNEKILIEKGSNSHEDSSNTEITISQLNDDCLRCILAFLPFKDRLRLQRVSKRWQTLMPWNVQGTLVVGFDNFKLGQECWMFGPLSALEKVLRLCGNFLTDIETTFWYDVSHEEAENYLKMFKNLCPNLIDLDLRNFNLNQQLIEFLIQNFADLKSFGICGYRTKVCEKEITNFFTKAKNLREIKFSESTFQGTCLTALPLVSIEKFMVSDSENMLLENVCEAFQNMKNLSTLDIIDNVVLIQNFDRLLKELPNRSKLGSLSLHLLPSDNRSFMDRERILQMRNLCYLSNLQELFLKGPQVVHDEALTIIGNTCRKLKMAALLDSHKLTDNGWKNFAELTNIEILKIGELDTISDKCFDYFQASSLKTLVCYKISLTNKSFQTLLNSAKNLNHLDVSVCPRVNRATLIKDVSAQIESRPKYEIFTLHLEIDDSTAEITDISTRLIVKNTNYKLFGLEDCNQKVVSNDTMADSFIRNGFRPLVQCKVLQHSKSLHYISIEGKKSLLSLS